MSNIIGSAFRRIGSIVGAVLSPLQGILGSLFPMPDYGDGGGNQDPPSYGISLRNTVSKDMPVPIVFGKRRIFGNVIHAERRPAVENNAIFREVIAIGEGPIKSVSEFRLGDLDYEAYNATHKGFAYWLGTATQTHDSPDYSDGEASVSFVADAAITTEYNDTVPEQ